MGPRRVRSSAPAGFTLLELLVAVTILALIAVMSWRGLSSLTATRERLEPQGEDVRAVLAGFGQLQEDLAQAPLSARLFALPVTAVRVRSIDGRVNLMILRSAESPDGSRAAALQAVVYRVADGALQRLGGVAQHIYLPDGPIDGTSVMLVPGVDDMQVRVWRNGVGWIAPAGDNDTAGAPGVEIRLLRHDGRILRRVFAVG